MLKLALAEACATLSPQIPEFILKRDLNGGNA